MANTRLKSLRQAIWGGDKVDPQSIGEALRDLYQAFNGLTQTRVVKVAGVTWAVPFTISSDHLPDAVLMVRGRIAKTPTAVPNGTVAYDWFNNQVRVNSIDTLTVGTSYDLVFQVIG